MCYSRKRSPWVPRPQIPDSDSDSDDPPEESESPPYASTQTERTPISSQPKPHPSPRLPSRSTMFPILPPRPNTMVFPTHGRLEPLRPSRPAEHNAPSNSRTHQSNPHDGRSDIRHLHSTGGVVRRTPPSTPYSSVAGFVFGASPVIMRVLSSAALRTVRNFPGRLFHSPSSEPSRFRLNGLGPIPLRSLSSPPQLAHTRFERASAPQLFQRSSAPSVLGAHDLTYHMPRLLLRTSAMPYRPSTAPTNVITHANSSPPTNNRGPGTETTSPVHGEPGHDRASLHSSSRSALGSDESVPSEHASVYSLAGTRESSDDTITAGNPTSGGIGGQENIHRFDAHTTEGQGTFRQYSKSRPPDDPSGAHQPSTYSLGVSVSADTHMAMEALKLEGRDSHGGRIYCSKGRYDAPTDCTTDVLTPEDLKVLKHNIPFAGSGVSIHAPTRALDWLARNNDHDRLRRLRGTIGSLSGPFPYLLPNFTDALALYAESGFEADDSEEARIVQSLAQESGLPFVILSKDDEPDLDSEESENQDEQGRRPKETHPSSDSKFSSDTEALRLRGGAGGSQLSMMQEAGDVWPHSLSEPHTLDIEVCLSSSTIVRIFSEFRFGTPAYNPPGGYKHNIYSFTESLNATDHVLVAVNTLRVAGTSKRVSFDSSTGNICFLGPEADPTQRFRGDHFLQLDNKPPGHIYKKIRSQNDQFSVTAAATASNPVGFGYIHARNNVLETQDNAPTPEWTVRPVGYAPTPAITNRSLMSVDAEYTPDPQLKPRQRLTVSYGLATGIARPVPEGISFIWRNQFYIWVLHPASNTKMRVAVVVTTFVKEVQTPTSLMIEGSYEDPILDAKTASAKALSAESISKPILSLSRLQRYLPSVMTRKGSDAGSETTLDGNFVNLASMEPSLGQLDIHWPRVKGNTTAASRSSRNTHFFQHSG